MVKREEKKHQEDLSFMNGMFEYIQMLSRGNYGDLFFVKDRAGKKK
jgi:hypothetical protein